MSDTPALHLPMLAAEQAQKHVTMNEALLALDALVQLAVLDRDLSAPPAAPADGDRHIVAAAAGGEWSGHAGEIAVRQNGAWSYHAPRPGWRAWVEAEAALLVFAGGAWLDLGGLLRTLQNLTGLGIGTVADAANPFAARLNSALWTARPLAEGGSGDLRLVLNKEESAASAGLLLQRGFAGRAEIGLLGDDDLVIKVSADGTVWREALRVDCGSGIVSMPAGTSFAREKLNADRTYFVRPDGSDSNSGLVDDAGGAFLTLQRAYDQVAAIDTGGFATTIQLADGTHGGLVIAKPWLGGRLTLQGNAAAPANAVIATSGADCIRTECALGGVFMVKDLKLTASGTGSGINHGGSGLLNFQNLEFGAFAGSVSRQIQVSAPGAIIVCTGNYTVSGGAAWHVQAGTSGVVFINGVEVTIVGAPTYSKAFAFAAGAGLLDADNTTFTGGASGARYNAILNGTIYTSGGPNHFPGTIAGSTASGGQYI